MDMRPSEREIADTRVTALAAQVQYLQSVVASLRHELAQARATERQTS